MAAPHRDQGLTLLELLLALSLGLLLSSAMIQTLLADSHGSTQLLRQLRQRQQQQRVLALVRRELLRSERVSLTPAQEAHACDLAGRSPVLHLSGASGSITYSVGAAPSGIWRGVVLMRCGPPYGLDGRTNPAAVAQNRVLVDGLVPGAVVRSGTCSPGQNRTSQGFSACIDPQGGLVQLLIAQVAGGTATNQSELLAAAPQQGDLNGRSSSHTP
jgi:prepilin-type N-terminal cleavage/methylation domain-containing protein